MRYDGLENKKSDDKKLIPKISEDFTIKKFDAFRSLVWMDLATLLSRQYYSYSREVFVFYRCIIIIAFAFIIVLKRNLLLHQFVPRKPCNHHSDCRNLVAQFIAQKMKFPIKDLFSKCEHIRSFLRIWSYLLKKSLMKNFIFCAVVNTTLDWSKRSRKNMSFNPKKSWLYSQLTIQMNLPINLVNQNRVTTLEQKTKTTHIFC